MKHTEFKKELHKFISSRNIGPLCTKCTFAAKNKITNRMCDCSWRFGPGLKSIYQFFKATYNLKVILTCNYKYISYNDIFNCVFDYNTDCNNVNFIWAQNLYIFIFPMEDIAIVCNKHLTKNIPLFDNIVNNTLEHKKMFNFKYYNYDLAVWLTGPYIYIFDEESPLEMVCFKDRSYEQSDVSDVMVSNHIWYKKTFIQEVRQALKHVTW